MTSNYNGVRVEWTAKEAAKIAEIKARRDWIPAVRVEVQEEPGRQQYMDGLERKITRSKAMYWLWRCGVELPVIADVFDLSVRKVRAAIDLVREGNVEDTRYRA